VGDIVRDIGETDVFLDQLGVTEVILDHHDLDGRAHQ
jgi:hypothetical protein